MDFAQALQYMLKDSGGGVKVTVGSSSGYCIYETKPTDVFRGEIAVSKANERTALVETGVPAVSVGTRITLEGPKLSRRQFDVRDIQPEDEGALSRLYLKDV